MAVSQRSHAWTPLTILTLFHRLSVIFPASATAADDSQPSPSLPSGLWDDVAAFIPACAEECVRSFLSVNYANGDDADADLSLGYVCANRGRSGYTIAEGALQCLTGEKQVGFCTGVDAGGMLYPLTRREVVQVSFFQVGSI